MVTHQIVSTILIVLLSFYYCPAAAQKTATECKISVRGISEDSPLILQHTQRRGTSPFHTPSDPTSGTLTFSSGDPVRFACPDADDNMLVIPNSPLMVYEVIAFCLSDSTFTISGAPYLFSNIRCRKPPQSTVKEEGPCDVGSGSKFNIGFKLRRKFLGIIEICYDKRRQCPVSARYTLSKSVGAQQNYLQRNNQYFKDITRTPEDLYNCKNQAKNLGRLLGSQEQAKKYINCDHRSNSHLTDCHLAPASDFLFGYQKKSTSYYINTAPQWQTINTGNWKNLESRIQRYTSAKNADLTIVTGTMNITTLPDVSGNEQQLYLSRDLKKNPTVPVPALFWKLLHDRNRNAGIVFVTVNNPYHGDLMRQGYVICTNICASTTSWFDGWNRMDVRNGYVYCCTVNDFKIKSGIKPFPYRVKYILR